MSSFLTLVINSGSSSVKFSVFLSPEQTCVASGAADGLGNEHAKIKLVSNGEKQVVPLPGADHQQALETCFEMFAEKGIDLDSIKTVGHRVVHGGEAFNSSVVIDDQVIEKIKACSSLAPLHNPANLLGIEVTQKLIPQATQIAVFDTAFHQSLDQVHYLYPVPWSWYEDYGVRKYGFHGTSHEYVSQQAVQQLNLDPQSHGVLVAHIGGGVSATAVENGKSVDTTMGLTPLEGLMMGTRSGDVDPSLHKYMADTAGMSLNEVDHQLNKASGLLGISGVSDDMRPVEANALEGEPRCLLAVDMFSLKLAKYLAALSVSLSRIDALVFTGGIGENSAFVRQKVVKYLVHLGFQIDEKLNEQNAAVISEISSRKIAVIATNEELQIANHCLALSN